MIIQKVTRTKFMEKMRLDSDSDWTKEEAHEVHCYIDKVNDLYLLDMDDINERFKSSTTDEVRQFIDSETDNIHELCDELRGHCLRAVVLEEVRDWDDETEPRIVHLTDGLDI